MKKIFLKVLGYTFCVILIVICIMLIVAASMFGASKTVDIFGFNIYLVDNDYIPTAPKGSAVLVKKGKASELEEGKLVLYLKPDADDEPTLGYVKDISARDGVHYVTVSYHDQPYEFPEGKLVGRADYSSTFWGGVIGFIKTPMGVMVLAVLPCAALILFDLARVVSANRPEPEVVPRVKNADEETHSDIKLSVDREGKALYSKDRSLKPLPKDSDVLFNYSGKQSGTKKDVPRNARPIIPLTDRDTSTAPRDKTGTLFDVKIPPDDDETALAEPQKSRSTEVLPDSKELANAASRFSQNYRRLPPEGASAKTASNEANAETSAPAKKQSRDAFFAQSLVGKQNAPQIGRSTAPRHAAGDTDEPAVSHPRTEKTAGKRSTQILASKSLDDIFSDDDDRAYSRSMNDKAVDDILAGINRSER